MMNYVYRMDLPTSIPTESRGPDLERDSEIAELTGIWPDPRYFISLAETKEMIRGVQAGDVGGAEALIATRLRWINDRYAQTDAVVARNDLELADIMHAGGLATIRVAEKIDTGSLENSSYLHSPIVHGLDSMLDNGRELFEPSRLLYRLMEAGKLLPAVRPDGSMPLYQAAEEQQEAAAGRHVVATGLRRGEILAAARDRSDGADVQSSAEAVADRQDCHGNRTWSAQKARREAALYSGGEVRVGWAC
jgi:hypothetical protein